MKYIVIETFRQNKNNYQFIKDTTDGLVDFNKSMSNTQCLFVAPSCQVWEAAQNRISLASFDPETLNVILPIKIPFSKQNINNYNINLKKNQYLLYLRHFIVGTIDV